MKVPKYAGLAPRSLKTSERARASSRKKDTRCEMLLRRAMWRLGLMYRLHSQGLPGKPDIIFSANKIAVFVDGDFWHGRNLRTRIRKLSRGHNATYWIKKIRANVDRDRRNTSLLKKIGWHVIRVWESDVHRDSDAIARSISKIAHRRRT